jgi:hypothetical protein
MKTLSQMQIKMFELIIENTYENSSIQNTTLNDSDLDQMINEINAFVLIISSNEIFFAMILMKLSIVSYSKHNINVSTFFTCDVTKISLNVLFFNI